MNFNKAEFFNNIRISQKQEGSYRFPWNSNLGQYLKCRVNTIADEGIPLQREIDPRSVKRLAAEPPKKRWSG